MTMTVSTEKLAAPKPRRGYSIRAQEARLAWFLLAPTALIVFGVVLFPAIFSVWISFRDVGLKELGAVLQSEFIGLDNYRAAIDDFAFKFQGLESWGAAVTSVVYSVVATAVTMLIGLIAALVLNRRFRARGLARAVFLFPYIAPIVSVAFVWRWILDPRPSGVLNDILMGVGLIDLPRAYLAQRGLALVLVIVFTAWRYFPFAMLMLLARLQAIDATLYEAADVDGAGEWGKFWNVTIPELRYVLGSLFLLRLIWTFNKFDDIWLLTSGGFGTNVLPVLTYQFSFKMNNFGKGAANAMILLLILVVFLVLYLVVMRRGDEE
jgi:multiple sugar transport system permease protein